MAFTFAKNLDELLWTVVPYERDINTKGELAFHPSIVEMYNKKGYDLEPKTRADADALGKLNFNGHVASIIGYPRSYEHNGKLVLSVDLAPTRYLWGQAMKDYVKQFKPTLEEMKLLSPFLANTSIIAPCIFEGVPSLMSAVKGKAVGEGEVHAALSAGVIDYADLSSKNPFLNGKSRELFEEIGYPLSRLQSTAPAFAIDERELGGINFPSYATVVDPYDILHVFERNTKAKLWRMKELSEVKDYVDAEILRYEAAKSINPDDPNLKSPPSTKILAKMMEAEKLETQALAALPVAALTFIRLVRRQGSLYEVTVWYPGLEKLRRSEKPEIRKGRPFTDAFFDDIVADKQSFNYFRERTGL